MHFRSLCVSDTHSLEPARAEVDIDSREQTRKSGVPVRRKNGAGYNDDDDKMRRCFERLRNRAKAERGGGCAKGCRKIYICRVFVFPTLYEAPEKISYIQGRGSLGILLHNRE